MAWALRRWCWRRCRGAGVAGVGVAVPRSSCLPHMLSCTRHPSRRMYASVQRGLMLPALALVSAFQSFGVASSGTAPMFVVPAPGQKGLCTHSQQLHKAGIIEFRQCAGNVTWTYGHVRVAHTLLCCHSPHACSCACVTSWSTTPAHQHTRAHTRSFRPFFDLGVAGDRGGHEALVEQRLDDPRRDRATEAAPVHHGEGRARRQ